MSYFVSFTDDAKGDIARLRRSEPQAYKKLFKLLEELTVHPRTGTGRVELMREDRSGQFSRRITQKHRLVYIIREDTLTVLILSAYGHLD